MSVCLFKSYKKNVRWTKPFCGIYLKSVVVNIHNLIKVVLLYTGVLFFFSGDFTNFKLLTEDVHVSDFVPPSKKNYLHLNSIRKKIPP